MALTPQQVIAVLKIQQNFNLLNTSAPFNFETLQDVTNWASINIISGNGDTAKCIFQVVDPTGSIIYQNANWVAGTYAAPDTTLTALTSTSKTINTFSGTNIPITGVYTVNVQVQVIPNGGPTVVASASFPCNLQNSFAPAAPQTSGPHREGENPHLSPPIMPLALQETANCQQATY